MADSVDTVAKPPQAEVSRGTRWLAGVMSVTLFGIVGAWLGSKLGTLGDKKGHTHAQRLLTWLGGISGGLLAVASQPESRVRQQEYHHAQVSEAASVVLSAAAEKPVQAAGPLPHVTAHSVQPAGTLQPASEHVLA